MSQKKITRKGTSSAGKGPMDVDLLQQIVKLMAANDLNTVDLRDGQRRIVMKRGKAEAVGYAPVMAPAAIAHIPTAAPSAPSAAPQAAAPAGSDEAGLVPIKSPMVGTFYSSPSPDAKPFVSVGDRIDEDTDICIIEAMKVFNNIKAETRGTVAKVLATNGQTVEFGQVLFLVKP